MLPIHETASFVPSPDTFIDGDKHDDCRCYQGKNDIECDFFTVSKQHISQYAPQKRETYRLTVCYLSTRHLLHLFS